MRRPADGAGAGASVLVGVETLVIAVVPAPAPSTLLMTPLYSERSVALLAKSDAVAPVNRATLALILPS
jgi:hypothetical protein